MTEVSYDEFGYVRGVSFHDDFLDGVCLEGSNARLLLRTSSGDPWALLVEDVKALRVDNFREGNIVLNLRLVSTERAVADPVLSSMLADKLLLSAQEALASSPQVFVLESSFGADLVAMCRSIRMVNRGL